MKIHLGYVALSLTLEDTSYSRTMTYTSYKKKDAEESNKILSEKRIFPIMKIMIDENSV